LQYTLSGRNRLIHVAAAFYVLQGCAQPVVLPSCVVCCALHACSSPLVPKGSHLLLLLLLRLIVLQGFAQPVVLVTAKRRSVHRDGPTAGASKLVFNIGALIQP
jgi:hypothetical protein